MLETKYAWIAAGLLAFATPASARQIPDLSGAYRVDGTISATQKYSGTASFSKVAANIYRGSWTIGSITLLGPCFLEGATLSCASCPSSNTVNAATLYSYIPTPTGLDGLLIERGATAAAKERLIAQAGVDATTHAGNYTVSWTGTNGSISSGTLALKQLGNISARAFSLDWVFGTMKEHGVGIRSASADRITASTCAKSLEHSAVEYTITNGGRDLTGSWIQSSPVKVGGETLSKGAFVSSFGAPSASIAGGTSVTATVMLDRPAPAGGSSVSLRSTKPAIALVPATVTIPAGQRSASFQIAASEVASAEVVEISASYGGITKSAQFTIARAVTSEPADGRAAARSTAAGSTAAGSFRIVLPSGTVSGKAEFCSIPAMAGMFVVHMNAEGVSGVITGTKSKTGVATYSVGDGGLEINVIRTAPAFVAYPGASGELKIVSWTQSAITGTFRIKGTVNDAEGSQQEHAVTGTFSAVPMAGCGQ